MTDTVSPDPDPTVRAIRFETIDRIALLTFDQPEKLNPMTAEMVEQSLEAIERVALDDELRVLVITGAGRAFSAGGDVRALGDDDGATAGVGDGPRAGPSPFERRAWLRRTQRLILAIHRLEKPVIAAINGVAAGGGCDIALACDIRFMATEARIGEIFANIGLFPGTGGTWFLPRIVGPEKALELIWTAELIDGPEAGRIGLVATSSPASRSWNRPWPSPGAWPPDHPGSLPGQGRRPPGCRPGLGCGPRTMPRRPKP